jgi:hypothetical protein
MPSLWFVVPVHGRLPLARICLRQLRRTCDALVDGGVQATAVVVSDALTLRQLEAQDEFGFATVERDNLFTSRRFNDGIQLATDPKFNPSPADYVVPCGSDDWVDYRLFLEPLPPADTIFGFQHMSFVSENGREITATFLNYEGGSGIRVIPRELVAPLGYRPADEDRARGCDTSILRNLRRHHNDRLKVKHWHLHDRQIVDWKTTGAQLNPYREVTRLHRSRVDADPFAVLAEYYPAAALDEMEQHYFGVKAAA